MKVDLKLPRQVWVASGHVGVFSDPLTECQSCHKRFRADQLEEAFEYKKGRAPESLAEINEIFKVSGGSEMFDTIEQHSDRKARELGYEEGADQKYMMDVFLNNSNEHY